MSSLFKDLVVSKDEVIQLVGIDPSLIADDSNPSNKVERLIYQAQETINSYCLRNYKRNAVRMYHSLFNEEEKEHFKMAVALMVKYIMYNGDRGNEPISETEANMISKNVLNELSHCRNLVSSKLSGTFNFLDWYFYEMAGR